MQRLKQLKIAVGQVGIVGVAGISGIGNAGTSGNERCRTDPCFETASLERDLRFETVPGQTAKCGQIALIVIVVHRIVSQMALIVPRVRHRRIGIADQVPPRVDWNPPGIDLAPLGVRSGRCPADRGPGSCRTERGPDSPTTDWAGPESWNTGEPPLCPLSTPTPERSLANVSPKDPLSATEARNWAQFPDHPVSLSDPKPELFLDLAIDSELVIGVSAVVAAATGPLVVQTISGSFPMGIDEGQTVTLVTVVASVQVGEEMIQLGWMSVAPSPLSSACIFCTFFFLCFHRFPFPPWWLWRIGPAHGFLVSCIVTVESRPDS